MALHGCRYVWDPFTESLRDEYYFCPDERPAFEETWTTAGSRGPSCPQSDVSGAAVVS